VAIAESVREADVVVIGAGQAGLAVGYYLRRTGLSFVLLDADLAPGGAWRDTWPSLRLFSPAQWSSLPGWMMPSSGDEYPLRDDVVGYLAAYEQRYQLPVERPVRVRAVHRRDGRLLVETDREGWTARAVVSATGTWADPVVPVVPGSAAFRGMQLHSAHYSRPELLRGRRTIVVGAGNSGAQIVAELADVTDVVWATREAPRFLPDDVDGRVLFEQATARYRALREGRPPPPTRSLGDVVSVPAVRVARARGVLNPIPMFDRLEPGGAVWSDGTSREVEAIVWATGFRPALAHLSPLEVIEPDGRVRTEETRAILEPRLWLVGYGNWTGYASATLVGVGRTARSTVAEIDAVIGAETRAA
jgi:putative flavoprotein involved in K+ transport